MFAAELVLAAPVVLLVKNAGPGNTAPILKRGSPLIALSFLVLPIETLLGQVASVGVARMPGPGGGSG